MTSEVPLTLTTAFVEADLRLLEGSIACPPMGQQLESVPLDAADVASVEHAAQRIAEFVGLDRYRFVTTFYSLQEQTAGDIEIRDDVIVTAGGIQLRASFGDVCFIRLARTLRSSPSALRATLAHEIAHKYLQENGVGGPHGSRGFEDEVLTDITSIWIGLGKLVLNACESCSVETRTDWGGTSTITTRHKVGYLTRTQFAFVYLLVAGRSGLSAEHIEHGLSSEALGALGEVRRELRDGRTAF